MDTSMDVMLWLPRKRSIP